MNTHRKKLILWNSIARGGWLLVAVIAVMLSHGQLCFGQSQRFLEYSPWGIDEYEVFGLTAPQIEKRFSEKALLTGEEKVLRFKNQYSETTASFHLGYDHGKVCSVQREFIAHLPGYTATGPELKSKEAALEYLINTQSAKKALDQNLTRHLVQAKNVLADLRGKQTKDATHASNTQQTSKAAQTQHETKASTGPRPHK